MSTGRISALDSTNLIAWLLAKRTPDERESIPEAGVVGSRAQERDPEGRLRTCQPVGPMTSTFFKERTMTMASGFGLARIGQIAVNVHDLEKAIGFYRDSLGMQFLFKVPHMAFFSCGDVRLMLAVPEKPEFDHPSSVIYFKVENIQGAFDVLGGRGVQFVAKPHRVAPMKDHDLWMAFFRDADDNLLALMSEVPHP